MVQFNPFSIGASDNALKRNILPQYSKNGNIKINSIFEYGLSISSSWQRHG